MGEQEQAEKKIVTDALLRMSQEEDAVAVENLQELLWRVKSKKARKLLTIALSRRLAVQGWGVLKGFFGDAAGRGALEGLLIKFKTAEAHLACALFYNKKNPDALGCLGLLYMYMQLHGDGLQRLSAARKIPRERWHDLSYLSAVQQMLDSNKSLVAGWWEEVATSTRPAPRFHHSSCRDSAGCMYVFGGLGKGSGQDMQEKQDHPVLCDLWVLDMQSSPMSWARIDLQTPSQAQDHLPAMRSAAVCVCASTLYIHGGEGEGSGAELFAVDLQQKVSKRVRVVQQSNNPGQRIGHAMFQHQGSLYLWGGHATDTLVWQLDTSAGTPQWVQKGCDTDSPPPMHGLTSSEWQQFSWWFDRGTQVFSVWEDGVGLWTYSISTGQWSRPASRHSHEGFEPGVAMLTKRACGSGGGEEGMWTFGGFFHGHSEAVVLEDEHGVGSAVWLEDSFSNQVEWRDAGGKVWLAIPDDGVLVPRVAAAAIQPLPAPHKGFVLFGGYNEYNENENGLTNAPNVFGATYVFRLSVDTDTATPAEGRQGEGGVSAAAGRRAEGAVRAEGASTQLVDVDWLEYNTAIEEVVQTEEAVRRRLSQIALAGFRSSGKGAVAIEHGRGMDASGVPLPVRAALQSASFVPAAQLQRMVSADAWHRNISKFVLPDLRSNIMFMLCCIHPDPSDSSKSLHEVFAFAPGSAAGPGVGDMRRGPFNPNDDQLLHPSRSKPMWSEPGFEAIAAAAKAETARIIGAATREELAQVVVVKGSVKENLDNALQRCDGPGCFKVAASGLAKSMPVPSTHGNSALVDKLLKCIRCKAVQYCGTECQTAHWRAGHKQDCKQLAAARAFELMQLRPPSLAAAGAASAPAQPPST